MAIEKDIGPIEAVIYNLGAQIGDRNLQATSYRAFEMGWRLATFGLFRTASVVTPKMEERGRGTILVTSATAAVRGNKGQHSHAADRAGGVCYVRAQTQSLVLKGIHVLYHHRRTR